MYDTEKTVKGINISKNVHCGNVFADPAFNSCRDPGTPAYGIPVMAQGFQVRNIY